MTTRNSWMNGKLPRPSSVSLRGMEIAIPPGQTIPQQLQTRSSPPVTMEAVAEHYMKPLPPPPARHSAASTLSKQLDQAFGTAAPRGPTNGGSAVWAQSDEAAMAHMLEKVGLSPDRPVSLAKLNARKRESEDGALGRRVPSTPPDDVLATQSKMSVQKILRLTRDPNHAVGPIPMSPSGHNPAQKIKQLTGLDVNTQSDVDQSSRSSLLLPVSPMTPTSSIYSQEGLEATISEPDSEVHGSFHYDGASREEDADDITPEEQHGSAIEWKDWWTPASPGTMPPPLTIFKRSHSQMGISPRTKHRHSRAVSHEEPLSPRSPPGHSSFSQGGKGEADPNPIHELDLYHVAAAQIAQVALGKANSAGPSAPSDPSPQRSFALAGTQPSPSSTSPTIPGPADSLNASHFSLPNPDKPLTPEQRKSSFYFAPGRAAEPEEEEEKPSRAADAAEGHQATISGREYQSRVRMAPPAALKSVEWHAHELSQRSDSPLSKASTVAGASGSTFGTGDHPLHTPYPPNKVGRTPFDEDEDEMEVADGGKGFEYGDGWSAEKKQMLFEPRDPSVTLAFGVVGGDAPEPQGKTLTKRKSMVACLFHGDHAPNSSTSIPAMPDTQRAGQSEPMMVNSGGCQINRQEAEPASQPEQPKRNHQRRGTGGRLFFLSNKSRRPKEPATPFPSPIPPTQREASTNTTLTQKTGGLVNQALTVAGIKTKAEKRREDLKSKIRMVTPGPSEKGGHWF